jgi:hypothetical protein
MDQQQHHDDEPEGQQEVPVVNPVMSDELGDACMYGEEGKVVRLLDDGESVNGVNVRGLLLSR